MNFSIRPAFFFYLFAFLTSPLICQGQEGSKTLITAGSEVPSGHILTPPLPAQQNAPFLQATPLTKEEAWTLKCNREEDSQQAASPLNLASQQAAYIIDSCQSDSFNTTDDDSMSSDDETTLQYLEDIALGALFFSALLSCSKHCCQSANRYEPVEQGIPLRERRRFQQPLKDDDCYSITLSSIPEPTFPIEEEKEIQHPAKAIPLSQKNKHWKDPAPKDRSSCSKKISFEDNITVYNFHSSENPCSTIKEGILQSISKPSSIGSKKRSSPPLQMTSPQERLQERYDLVCSIVNDVYNNNDHISRQSNNFFRVIHTDIHFFYSQVKDKTPATIAYLKATNPALLQNSFSYFINSPRAIDEYNTFFENLSLVSDEAHAAILKITNHWTSLHDTVEAIHDWKSDIQSTHEAFLSLRSMLLDHYAAYGIMSREQWQNFFNLNKIVFNHLDSFQGYLDSLTYSHTQPVRDFYTLTPEAYEEVHASRQAIARWFIHESLRRERSNLFDQNSPILLDNPPENRFHLALNKHLEVLRKTINTLHALCEKNQKEALGFFSFKEKKFQKISHS